MIILGFLGFVAYFIYTAKIIQIIGDAWWNRWFGFPLALFAVFFPAVVFLQVLCSKGLL